MTCHVRLVALAASVTGEREDESYLNVTSHHITSPHHISSHGAHPAFNTRRFSWGEQQRNPRETSDQRGNAYMATQYQYRRSPSPSHQKNYLFDDND